MRVDDLPAHALTILTPDDHYYSHYHSHSHSHHHDQPCYHVKIVIASMWMSMLVSFLTQPFSPLPTDQNCSYLSCSATMTPRFLIFLIWRWDGWIQVRIECWDCWRGRRIGCRRDSLCPFVMGLNYDHLTEQMIDRRKIKGKQEGNKR